jgi:hypothetical protein
VIGRSRAERKAAAVLRAELALKHAFERIDFDYDVVVPKLEEIRQLEAARNTVTVPPELEAGKEAQDAVRGLA